ncbi:Phosphoribosyl pyrophosphate synthase-associated protein 1 [Liparis tanakae]|uniref:Phosphoribosyl pyrophosphate synthase-associated protein 1 n=1 Tax=Liparis tanakae TaxID=230148 RepID=A0A4Z2H3X3_9TELE|nr:Phosphoribosyl pyrophosphate synthase-associated protein 1 [Liparis tanakae]
MPIRRFGGHRSLVAYSRIPTPSYEYKKMNVSKSGYRVFSANSSTACTELAKKITERLGVELGKSLVYQESNGETRVDVKESVRGQDIFIIQTIPRDVNSAIMELLVMAYALKTSCAKNIIGVIPYFPYSKQCKMRKRGSIVCKLLAAMLAKAGLTHIITMDLHQKEIQGFFSFPVDNLRASPFLIQYIQEEVRQWTTAVIVPSWTSKNEFWNQCLFSFTQIPDYRNAIIVAKSPSAAKRAQSYAERLRLGLAVMHGEAHHSELDMVDGRQSPPFSPPPNRTTQGHTGLELPLMMAKEKPPITVVGDVGGRIAIIVDDIIDNVEDFVAAAETLKERGAYKIYIMATHGLLSADAPRLIEESAIDEVVVTNTVPHEVQKLQCPKIKTVDVSMILAEAIRRIHNGESMAYLFRNIAVDD